jgi:hypothetical protein
MPRPITLDQFVKKQFHPLYRNYSSAISHTSSIKQELGDRQVLRVVGNGNCLIKSIVAYILCTRDASIIELLLLPLLDKSKVDLLVATKDNIKCVAQIIDSDIIDELCQTIRDKIVNEWDYIGCPEYHLDANAIDGLAREMVLRILCVGELVVFSLNPNKNTSYKKIITVDTTKFKNNVTPWKVTLICAQDFCHYSALI